MAPVSQWLRKCQLYVKGAADNGLDLSQMQIRFEITQAESFGPNIAVITVLNLNPSTEAKIIHEFTEVWLNAGYQPPGNCELIFHGNIIQVRRGKLDATTTFLEIYAGDSEIYLNHAFTSSAVGPGASKLDDLKQFDLTLPDDLYGGIEAAQEGINYRYIPSEITPGPFYPRGRPRFAVTNEDLWEFARNHQVVFSVQDGKAQLVPIDGYLPGEIVEVNKRTGLVGIPTQTEEGIQVTSLLNPRIRVSGLIKLDTAMIIPGRVPQAPFITEKGEDIQAQSQFPPLSRTDTYKVIVQDYRGDTRGNEWYSILTCYAVDV